ncbi:MAG: hypothetical protein EHM58_16615 [Ignavibacteriae bacterium]|nr:MAG: hypothetical protein EHM58_16615 [Ignavibacteriota bacterium]
MSLSKTLSFLRCSLLILLLILSFSDLYSQYNPYEGFTCLTPDTSIVDPYNRNAKTGTINLVIVYFDFPNGRLPGNIIPLTNEGHY